MDASVTEAENDNGSDDEGMEEEVLDGNEEDIGMKDVIQNEENTSDKVNIKNNELT